mgnify:CR=1 FL=1
MIKLWCKGVWQILSCQAGAFWLLPFESVTAEVETVRISVYLGIVAFVAVGAAIRTGRRLASSGRGRARS